MEIRHARATVTAQQQPVDLTIEEARAVQAVRPVPWQVVEETGGWAVRTGQARLVVTNGRKPRLFKSLEAAVRQLQQKVGAKTIEVVTSTS